MAVGTITPPLILGSVLTLPASDVAYLVSMSLFSSALGAWLQSRRRGPIGSGLLSVTGASFSFIPPLIAAGQLGGLALMVGMSVATAPLQLAVAPALPRLRRIFDPLVSGIVVLLIGLSLIPSAMLGIGGPATAGAPRWSGAAVAAAVVIVLLIFQIVGGRRARLLGIVAAVATGYFICWASGWLPHASRPGGGLVLPRWSPHGFAFRWELLLPFAFIYLVSLLEAMGDITATSQLSGLRADGDDHWRRLRGGVMADGLTSLVSGLFGALPSTTYAQNNGVIQVTGVASRHIAWIVATLFLLLGLIPQVAAWVTAMPAPVFSALALVLFGLVAAAGVRLIAGQSLGRREMLIVAVALSVGVALPSQKSWLDALPLVLRAWFESGIACGGLAALALNALWPKEDSGKVEARGGSATAATVPPEGATRAQSARTVSNLSTTP